MNLLKLCNLLTSKTNLRLWFIMCCKNIKWNLQKLLKGLILLWSRYNLSFIKAYTCSNTLLILYILFKGKIEAIYVDSVMIQ